MVEVFAVAVTLTTATSEYSQSVRPARPAGASLLSPRAVVGGPEDRGGN